MSSPHQHPTCLDARHAVHRHKLEHPQQLVGVHALPLALGLVLTAAEEHQYGHIAHAVTLSNALLLASGLKLPGFTKTGATICGLGFADGVVLRAVTQGTSWQKNGEKIHNIAQHLLLRRGHGGEHRERDGDDRVAADADAAEQMALTRLKRRAADTEASLQKRAANAGQAPRV